jgi:hypothetical protein
MHIRFSIDFFFRLFTRTRRKKIEDKITAKKKRNKGKRELRNIERMDLYIRESRGNRVVFPRDLVQQTDSFHRLHPFSFGKEIYAD